MMTASPSAGNLDVRAKGELVAAGQEGLRARERFRTKVRENGRALANSGGLPHDRGRVRRRIAVEQRTTGEIELLIMSKGRRGSSKKMQSLSIVIIEIGD